MSFRYRPYPTFAVHMDVPRLELLGRGGGLVAVSGLGGTGGLPAAIGSEKIQKTSTTSIIAVTTTVTSGSDSPIMNKFHLL